MKRLLLVVGLSGPAAACVPVDHGYYGAPGAVVISTSSGYSYGYPYGNRYGTYRRPIYYGRSGYGGAWYGPQYGIGHGQPGFGYPYGHRGGSYGRQLDSGHTGFGPRRGFRYHRPYYVHG